mgnify:CR=1 FL=1
MRRNLLITGGLGFIGHNFIKLNNLSNNYNIINVDNITSNFFLNNALELNNIKNYYFYNLDINNKKKISEIFNNHHINDIIHFAAESHVDNSINKPNIFTKTNVLGTSNLLENALYYWSKKDEIKKNTFLYISTDEVFGSLDLNSKNKFKSNSPIKPNSPYSASKAAGELMVRSFYKTYGLRTIITNTSNNFGPGQHIEKLIPKAIFALIENKKIPIYGSGKNMRDWIFVKDNVETIYKILQLAKGNTRFLIGGNKCINNNKLIKIIIDNYNLLYKKKYKFENVVEYVTDRKGHDQKYDVDNSSLKKLNLNISNKYFNKNILQTIKWYTKNYEQIKKLM